MRLALIRLSALGDIVHTWPLALSLKRSRPEIHLTWVVEAPFLPLVEGHPAVDGVIPVRTRSWRKNPFSPRTRVETGRVRTLLKELSPDIALDSQGTFKSAWITRWTTAPERIGLARPWRRERLPGAVYTRVVPGARPFGHIVETNLAIGRALGGIRPPGEVFPDGRWLLEGSPAHQPVIRTKGPYLALLPGAGRPSKILGVDVVAEVVRRMAARGLPSVILWGPGEESRAREIAGLSNGAAEVAPPTTIGELAVLLGKAALVIGGDTGPVHLAASLGVPTLGVFLTTDPRRNGPLGPRTAVVSSGILPPNVRPDRATVHPGDTPHPGLIEERAVELLDTVT